MFAASKWAVALIPLALMGCANFNSIHHRFKPDEGDALSIDAKQRAIYTVTKTMSGGHSWKAVCAEPSPDALAAISASAGVDAAVLDKALGLAFSSQEGAASIGLRTQTIQILRDAMYRLCEGYASGALDDIGFSRLQRRYQAIVIGLLSIEQLTGAVVARQAAIGGDATARLGQNLARITTMIQEARVRSAAAKAKRETAQAKLDATSQGEQQASDALSRAMQEAGGDEEAESVRSAKAALDQASVAKAQAQQELTQAVMSDNAEAAEVANLENLRKDIDRATAIASTAAQFSSPSLSAAPPDSAAYQKVADVVKDIVQSIVQHDYTQESCMDMILSRQTKVDSAADARVLQVRMYYCALALDREPRDTALAGENKIASQPQRAREAPMTASQFFEKVAPVFEQLTTDASPR
jgi:hypothetical protein